MLRTKKADRIACVGLVVMLLATTCLWGVAEPLRSDGSHTVGYEALLFDQSKVHTIDITMENWDEFIESATAEEYAECSITIDGERYDHVAIRAKGNTSLSSVAALGSTRYSFKVEFDHFVKGMTYHGLDKLSLNNLIQDATMMKDYLAYTLMNRMDVPAPLCSYVQINVGGEPWGLYLAVEAVEEAFLDRNGMSRGELYKPDSMSFGGGRGNGRDFDMDSFRNRDDGQGKEQSASEAPAPGADAQGAAGTEESGDSFGGSAGSSSGVPQGMPENMPEAPTGQMTEGQMPEGQMPDGGAPEGNTTPGEAHDAHPQGGGFGGFSFGMGNDDVKLVYTDDDEASYSNIFNNAKTEITERDKARLIEALRKLNAGEELEDTVNQDEVIRYLAVHNFLCNDDSYTGMMVHNYYLHEEKGKLSIIPWDYNLGFGGFSASSNATSTVNSPIDSPVSGGTTESRPLIAWIFGDEAATEAYHAAYDQFIAENLESGWLEEKITRVQEMITPYLEQDDSAFYDMEEFEQGVNTLQTFCRKRGESIRGQLEGTIPSTTQGQREESDALVDASEISTADMGSMNGSNAPGGGASAPRDMPTFQGGGDFTPPEGFTPPSDQNAGDSFGGSAGSSGERAAQDTNPPENDANAGGMDNAGNVSEASGVGGMEAPAQGNRAERPAGFTNAAGQPRGTATAQWIELALWSGVLLAVLLIVRRTKSHNG